MMASTQITCPGCGTVSHFDQMRRSSQEFCRRCDYPLFWVRAGDAAAPDPVDGDTGLRRLPGAGGHRAVASLGCPSCNEPNVYTATVCIRCGSDLRPAPLPPPPVFVAAEPEPEPLPEPEPIPPMWPQMLLFLGIPTLILLVMLTAID